MPHHMAATSVASVGALAVCWGAVTSAGAQHPIPEPDTPVRDVALAYWRAAVSGDCRATRAMSTADTWAWCDVPRVTAVDDVGLAAPQLQSDQGTSRACVTSVITNTGSGDGDGAVMGGRQMWTMCFEHLPQGWRVYQQGEATTR